MKLIPTWRPLWLAMSSVVCLATSGCLATAPSVEVLSPTQARPELVTVAPANNGSLFQAASYRPLYEAPRARLVGDLITVNITESLSAKQESTSAIEKQGSLSGSIGALPFMNATQLAKLDANASSSNQFDGKGSTESTNTFTGTITATVIEVLPNGHLIISGEKQIGVNQNVDVLRFSGQVDPVTIQPGNTVASSAVANVRVDQRGRGAQNAAQGIGWLGRFFLSVSPL
jgi:flagellar L-ring protein precursor FlgH